MRRLTLLAGLVLTVGVLLPGSALPAMGGSNLPLKGSITATSEHNLVTGQFHGVANGQLTHFGLMTLEQYAQIVITGPPITLNFTGTWTLTAANGDQLFGTATGIGHPTDATHITLVIDYTSTGGTGRFADASATFTATIYHTRTALVNGISYGEQQVTLDGELSW